MVELVDSVDLGSTAKSVQVRVLLPAPSPFVVIDTMATKGDFLFYIYSSRNSVFPKLLAYLFSFNWHMKIGFHFCIHHNNRTWAIVIFNCYSFSQPSSLWAFVFLIDNRCPLTKRLAAVQVLPVCCKPFWLKLIMFFLGHTVRFWVKSTQYSTWIQNIAPPAQLRRFLFLSAQNRYCVQSSIAKGIVQKTK